MTTPQRMAAALYAAHAAPWDIGAPQPMIRRLVALGAVHGRVLDPGCGTGWHAIEYARAGCAVTGIDAAMPAIARARRNARGAGVTVDFQIGDVATVLDGYDEAQFDVVVDSKCYDNLTPAARPRYIAGLRHVLKPAGKLYLYAFGGGHINGVHNHELEDLHVAEVLQDKGFQVDYVGETTYQLAAMRWQPICSKCPRRLPTDRLTIPIAEVHARAPKE
ncbi:thiopurine S-methyltransferase [Mycolicibacterium sp. TY66]|uniref:class I SAM-dependent methyltransferase n=1 Tax=unclassified Mycolicibacterium TaxID=2636767 RepID=UPI001BB3CB54|nr:MULTISPECIES: class I SAM-dependent methyltransferase [unclassified Mycolicibacterium]BCI78378.1 thiopurine S-methyltransferase [Mycolicibacterium sp. TY66]BCJ83960.1 thiopurine S-methyltransferase [Mycolicibacterium sp. TY81]